MPRSKLRRIYPNRPCHKTQPPPFSLQPSSDGRFDRLKAQSGSTLLTTLSLPNGLVVGLTSGVISRRQAYGSTSHRCYHQADPATAGFGVSDP